MSQTALSPKIAAVYELHAAFLEPKLKQIGVSWATFQLYSAVFAAGSSASQAEVARRLGLTPATLSESVQIHVRKGLLEQVPGANDRRVKILRLTAKAEKQLKQIRELISQAETVMLEGLSSEETRVVSALLDRCRGNFERILGDN